jgi:hypothetical protein
MSGITNIHNELVWSDENDWAIRSDHRQRQFSINMLAGILGENLIGPHILRAHVCIRNYFYFPRTHLSRLLKDVSFNTRLHMRLKHNGIPQHCSREMRQWLSENHSER